MHNSLAITVANAVLSDPTDSTVRIYCKSLSQMDLTASNEVSVTHAEILACCSFHRMQSLKLPALIACSLSSSQLSSPAVSQAPSFIACSTVSDEAWGLERLHIRCHVLLHTTSRVHKTGSLSKKHITPIEAVQATLLNCTKNRTPSHMLYSNNGLCAHSMCSACYYFQYW